MKIGVFVFFISSLFLNFADLWAEEFLCLDKATTQVQVNKCAQSDYKEADAQMSRVYNLIRKIYKEDKTFLKKLAISQQTWRKLRDADVRLKFFQHNTPGYYESVQPMYEAIFKIRLTQERTAFLKTWLEKSKQTDVSAKAQMVKTSGKTAKVLNSEGFALYKQGKYEEALALFKQSFGADDSYIHAHYNFACTGAILLNRDACRYLDELETIFTHLGKTVKLKPGYTIKMRNDPDLEVLRQFYRFYVIAGYDASVETDLFKILTSVSWYGPKPGVYPASPVFKFNKDQSVKISILKGVENPGYEHQTGRFILEGKTIRITFDQNTNARDECEAEFKNGRIVFKNDVFDTLTDNQDLCGA